MTTRAVLDHHLQGFGVGDLDMVMADYTEDSILITPDGTVRGLEAIREAFTEFFAGPFAPGSFEFSMGRVAVEEDVAFIVWSASLKNGTEVPLGTDTFVIRNNKIAVQTFAAHFA